MENEIEEVGTVTEELSTDNEESGAANAGAEETAAPPQETDYDEDGAIIRASGAAGVANEYKKLCLDADKTKESYPSFDLESECRDPRFTRLIAAGLGVKQAYEALHHEEIVTGAMQYAADLVWEAARKGTARSDHPAENGVAPAPAADPTLRVESLTAGDIKNILARVGRGEKIRF